MTASPASVRAPATPLALASLVLLAGCHREPGPPRISPPPGGDEASARRELAPSEPGAPTPGEVSGDDPSNGPGALVLRFVNAGPTVLYLHEPAIEARLECSRLDGETREPCSLFEPFCMDPCHGAGREAPCRRCARPTDAFRPIPPGTPVDIAWDRRFYRVVAGERCGCYVLEPARPGRHELRPCTFGAVSCYQQPCDAGMGDGVLRRATPVGEPTCVTVPFDPTAPGPVEILLAGPQP